MNFESKSGDNKVEDKGCCKKQILLYCLCGILLAISTAVLISFIVVHVPKFYTENYAVIIDAGSTGSRAFLYKWKDSADEENDVVTEITSCKADKLQNLVWTDPNNGLITCISNVIVDIPTSFLSRPYIYLASTAGMRLYQLEKPKETEILFANIQSLFQKKQWPSKYVGIISGEVEGISAWITANVLKNQIGKDIGRQQTIGALDLGGSSTQIAYEDPSSGEKVRLYGNDYPLYAKSYLCYGANMFMLKYLTYVAIKTSETSFNCLLKNAPVALEDDVKACRFPGSENLNFSTVTKKPNPDSTECLRQVGAVVDAELKFTKSPPNTKFVAMSSYFYTFSFFEKHYKIQRNLAQFVDSINRFCKVNYNDIPSKYPSEQKFAGTYCAVGTYIIKLFQGYGISNLENLEFVDKINGQSVGWNLGYMIDQTRSIPSAFIHKLDTSLFIAIIVIFSVLFVLSLLTLIGLICKSRQKVSNLSY